MSESTATDSPVEQAPRLEGEDSYPVGDLHTVLAALADPVRLEMVRRLDPDGASAVCRSLYDGISKSTASHHFKVLREAGVIQRRLQGNQVHQSLRLAEVEARHPGVLRAILATS